MDATTGRRITVFGASGFIGTQVVRRLAPLGWVVRAAVRDPVAAAHLRPLGNVGQVVPMRCDLGDEAAVAAAVDGADAVINLVGILFERGARNFQAVHADGADRLARLARAAGARVFVQVSAIGADADSPSAYQRSKAAGESAVRRAFPAAPILRPSIVFGPGDDFFNRFARLALLAPALPLIGGGHTRFQPVYVGDVAEAIVRALDAPEAAGRTFELGGPRGASFRELMELMLAEIDRRRRLVALPFWAARLQAAALECLPAPPLTRDQVTMLGRDNVCAPSMPGLAELGIQPTAMEAILPTYLDIFRRGGRFSQRRAA
jgi:NADH dehydrogenase